MSARETNGHDLLPYTFATWVFLLHVDGERSESEEVAQACDAILSAEDEVTGNAAGETLVAAVRGLLEGDAPEQVLDAASNLFGVRTAATLGQGDRTERTSRIRKYQFTRQLPWLARIWERGDDGHVRPEWLLVERVTDEVTAADPNPWNDIDETRRIPVGDFQVLWELDACTSVHLA
jgi:hypothetical protein